MNLYLISEWFFGLDVFFELAFALITLLVGVYAFKIYRLSNQNQSRLFGWAFILFSVSYFVQSFTNFLILNKLGKNACEAMKLSNIVALDSIGIIFYMVFFMSGLVTLTYMTLKIRSVKTYFLIMLISIFSIIAALNKVYLFYFLASVMLIFNVIYYSSNYSKRKNLNSFLILLSFIFLLFGYIHFIFIENHSIFYVIGHVFELGAYVLILVNLLLILKNGKKKK